jgi:hypothetical protein
MLSQDSGLMKEEKEVEAPTLDAPSKKVEEVGRLW